MPGNDRGRNSGVSGLVDITGTPKFDVLVYAFEETLGVQAIPVEGRGDATPWVPTMAVRPGGSLVITGTAQFRQPPRPAQFKGQEGTITLAYHSTAKETVPVRVDSCKISLAAKVEDGWKITLTATILSDPTLSGFGSDAPAATDPAPIEKETFAGLSKQKDPKNLLTQGTRSFFIAPIDNDDDDENQELAAAIADAVATDAGLKVKFARLEPGRTFNTGVITIQFNLTDSEEDVVNPVSATTLDPNDLTSQATAAGVYSPPTNPGGNFVARETTTQELHDSATLSKIEYGLRDTAEDVEMPGTITKTDPLGIESSGTDAEVFTTTDGEPADPAAPLGELQVVTTSVEELNRLKSVKRTEFDVLNSEEKRTYPKISTTDDAQNLQDEAVRAEFWDDGDTPPATPTDAPANNVKLIAFTDVPVTPTRNMRVWLYGPKNSRDDAVLPHYSTETDPSGLQSSAIRACLDGESISDPAGYVHRNTITRPLTVALGVNRTLTIKEYGLRTTAEDVTMPGTEVETDPDDLAGKAQETFVFDTGDPEPDDTDATITPPTDTKVIEEAVQELNQFRSKKVIRWGVRTAKQEIEWLKSRRTVDADAHLKDYALVVEVTNSATPDATGNNPDATNLSLYSSETFRLTDTQYVQAHEFRPFTSEEELEESINATVDDPGSSLIGDDMRCLLTTNAVEAPPTVSARVCVRRKSQRASKTEYQHTFWYGFRSNADKLEADRTTTTIDVDDLDTEGVTADVYTTASAPSDPTAHPVDASLKLNGHTDLTTDNPTYTIRVYKWAKTTSAERIINRETWTEEDPEGLESKQSKADINGAPDLDAGYELRSTRVQELNDDNSLYVVEGGTRSTKQDIEFLQSRAVAEAGQIDREPVTVEVTGNATPGSGTNPDATNLSLYRVSTHRITSIGAYAHAFEWKPLTATEKVQEEGGETTLDPGTIPLGNKARRRVVNTTAGTSAAPSVSGMVCFEERITRIAKLKYQHDYFYRYRSNEDDLIAEKTRTRTDPEGLRSEGVTADVWLVSGGAPADPADGSNAANADLKLYDYEDIEIANPLYRIRVYQWRLTDSKDDVELPGTRATFSQFENITRVETTIVEDDTSTVLEAVQTLRTTMKEDATVDRVTVERLNGKHLKQVVEFVDQFQLFRSVTEPDCRYMDAALVSGAVRVWVEQVVQITDALWSVYITPTYRWGTKTTFTLRRRLSTSIIPIDYLLLIPPSRNYAGFIGYPAGYVTYLGGDPQTERSVDAPHVMEALDKFEFNTHGHFHMGAVKTGWITTTADMTGADQSWIAASAFGWTDAVPFDTGDYSGFLL